jgi:hypothetical protein
MNNEMCRVLEILVGSILLYSGLLHGSAPYYFANAMAAYNILPSATLVVLPFTLPYLMLVVGCCLIFGVCEAIARHVAVVLFGVFFLAQVAAWISGAEISCGCFGHSTKSISLITLAIPAALGIVALGLSVYGSKRQHVAL